MRGSGEVMAGSGCSLAPVVPEPEDAALARAWSQRPGSASGATTEAQLGRTPGLSDTGLRSHVYAEACKQRTRAVTCRVE